MAERRRDRRRRSSADEAFRDRVAVLWSRGWTPADLVHVAGRRLTPDHAAVIARQLVAGSGTVGRASMHPAWREQLDRLRDDTPDGHVAEDVRLRLLAEALPLLTGLPGIPFTVPPPGGTGGDLPGDVRLDARMHARVRALLAKAESTSFAEEAEALTAKAQELIARHTLGEALLHTPRDVGEPTARRIVLDDPYASAKAFLVGEIARANRCRVVHSPDFGWVTGFGFPHDLAAVELLAASLLTQATAAMVREGPRRDARGRSRTRSFRHAFLLGFGQRIGERLRKVAETEVARATDPDDRLLPVLAAREGRVALAERRAFPDVRRRSASVGNSLGWSHGRAAAERAHLDVVRARPRLPRAGGGPG